MQKKSLLQLLILILMLMIILFFYKSYNVDSNTSNKDSDSSIVKKEEAAKKELQNLIYNIEYIAEGEDGNNYIIKAEVGELNNDKPELILMKKVTAIIYLKDSDPINISSDFANYNSSNFNTEFYENVLITHQIHVITSNNLDLIFEDNLATISNNVIYKNLNTTMQADKIMMDLITKESKIFMDNKSEKVKIVSKK